MLSNDNEGEMPGVARYLLVYGLCHALVDASCVYLVMGLLDLRGSYWQDVLLYNALAFCLQAPAGYLLDRFPRPRLAAASGLLLVALAFFTTRIPILAVVFAGVGNAVFHSGGGKIALGINTNKTSYAGIFVAPGGIGLALGIYLAATRIYVNWMIIVSILLSMTGVLLFTRTPAAHITRAREGNTRWIVAVLLLVLLSVSIRSVVGLTIEFPWRTRVELLVLLVVSIALGKSFGGIVADRFGWIRTGVGGLIASIPLLAFGASYPVTGLLGIFLFNFTMPITVVAISNILPGNPGFSFGLASFALFIGSLPTYSRHCEWLTDTWVVAGLIFVAAAVLYMGLSVLKRGNTTKIASS